MVPYVRATNRLGVLHCAQTRVTLSPKPFINVDILSAQMLSPIVKFLSYTQTKTKEKNTTHRKQGDLPPLFCR